MIDETRGLGVSKAQRRRVAKQQAWLERRSARQAAAQARDARQRERYGTGTGSLWGFLWDLAWAPLMPVFWLLSGAGRLMGIDTRQRGRPKARPLWMPEPDRQADSRSER